MDEVSIQRGGSTGIVPPGHNGGNATAAPGGFSVSFTDLLQHAGAPVGISFDALTDLAGNTADPDPAEPPAPAGDDGYDRFDDDGAGRGDDRPDAGRDTPDTELRDDRVADQGTARTDDPGAPPPPGDETPRESESAAGSADSEGDSGATEASNPNDGTTAETPSATGEPSHQDGETNIAGTDLNVVQAVSGTEHAGQVLAGVAAAQASKLPANAAEQTGERAGQAGERGGQAGERAGQGLSTAMAAVAKETPAQSQQPQTNAQGQQPQTTPGARAPANTAANPNNGAAAQAAALSKAVGEGNPVSVRVTVTNEAATLVSQPSSNLAASTVLSGTAGNQSQNGQSLHGGAGTNPAATHPAGGAGHGQQANIQAAQAQAAAGTEATGPVQGPVLANAATFQPQAGTGGTTAQVGAGAVGETLQTQQPAASATANAQRAGGPRPGVADQVSVHIAKALKAGVDRITIQLRPASLGRIDVQLEVGHDGRVMAVVTADNKDTLDLLQRDARELERALRDAGLQADSGSLSFNLRGQGNQAPEDGSADSGPPNDETAAAEPDDEGAPADDYGDGIIAEGRIDIRA
ncbi:MAG: flagellar hook-length control protein FliK [Alphaproteobacteria bacterium]|nr:flagellar hook-length control protein FliK [Alphaproteobacteria bacterium]